MELNRLQLSDYRIFKVFDFVVTYHYRPNEDRYQEILPSQLELHEFVPTNFKDLTEYDQKLFLKRKVIAKLEDCIMFDTPDAPEFAISDVEFEFETAD